MRTYRKTDFRKLKIALVVRTYHSQRPQCPSLSPHVLLTASDGIPNVLPKEFALERVPVTSDIYNVSVREGFILTVLKAAAVCPIPKRSPPKNIDTDLRPIPLTCQVA